MKCSVLGCERDARGPVPAHDFEGIPVPAHTCQFCPEHPCQMEVYILRRERRGWRPRGSGE